MAQIHEKVTVELPVGAGSVLANVFNVFARQVRHRCPCKVVMADKGEKPSVQVTLEPSIPVEGFEIKNAPGGGVGIAAADPRGVLYGLGKLLRTSRFERDGFVPGAWRGRSVPRRPVRGIYFATHFHNFYHEARLPEIHRYVEDLGLWGMNTLLVWYDMHHFDGIGDPAAVAMLDRLASILRAAQAVGLSVGLCLLSNEAYRTSPLELRADPETGRAHYNVELCPSKPKGRELILRGLDEEFAAFEARGVCPDFLWAWPYDQGGCACPACAPWGANGHVSISREIAALARGRFPGLKVILSTWLYDFRKNEGEWEGLAKAFARRPEWVDYLLADSHGDWPPYLRDHDVPGGLPLLNFPEISMWHMWPWGGLGANPGVKRFQRIWDQTGGRLAGGFPYSEGIFEDINKAIALRLYWDDQPAEQTLREYAAFEFSPDAADAVCEAAGILERNQRHCVFSTTPKPLPADLQDAGSARAWELVQDLDRRLPAPARQAWRWRIFYLRALLDAERFAHAGRLTESCRPALEELCTIYHAGPSARPSVMPPLHAIGH